MKIVLVLFLATVALANENKNNERHCYNELSKSCQSKTDFPSINDSQCNSKYLSFNKIENNKENTVLGELKKYGMQHLSYSYDHLLTAVNFGNYNKNREGFQKFFQKLSDSAWEKTIDIIKYVSKRGGEFKLTQHAAHKHQDDFKEFELGSMSNALDMTKELAIKANAIHHLVGKGDGHHDAEVSSFIEENFVHEHSSLIRELSGHTNDLKKMYSSTVDVSLSLFLFDEYLKE